MIGRKEEYVDGRSRGGRKWEMRWFDVELHPGVARMEPLHHVRMIRRCSALRPLLFPRVSQMFGPDWRQCRCLNCNLNFACGRG